MTEIKSTLAQTAASNPRRAMIALTVALTLLLVATDPAAAEGGGTGGYGGP